ncbi:hypothetical protein KUTeg_015997 [Tegillarca granosa]|uniref:TRAF-type domain-containing protein n=1 Tax=Tegillarca granosa TaxID=220873 RepID=A0ABQ9EJJ9_TEGGR|nr:hypothetical protein KUTeg_015997 [Tegillarca granosa]
MEKNIGTPPLKFRRIRYIGMKTFNRGKNLIQKVRTETMKIRTREERITSNRNPFDYIKLLAVMGPLRFAFCSGRNFLQFHDHLNTCRYRPVKCSNRQCSHVCQKWESFRHLNECKFIKIHCDYDGCKMTVQRGLLEAHRKICQFKPKPCPNQKLGCQMHIFSKELINHLDSCAYVEVKCKYCEAKVIRQYVGQHLNHCPLLVLECEACKMQIFRRDFSYHQDRCPNILYRCHNTGCEEILTKAQMMVHQNECQFKIQRCQNVYCVFLWQIERHKSNCEYRIIKCEDCGKYIYKKDFEKHKKEHNQMLVYELCKMTFPNSAYEVYKKWMCPRHIHFFVSHCDICYKVVQFSDLEDHKTSILPRMNIILSERFHEYDQNAFKSYFWSCFLKYVLFWVVSVNCDLVQEQSTHCHLNRSAVDQENPLIYFLPEIQQSITNSNGVNRNDIKNRFYESVSYPTERIKRCNSLPTEYAVESLVSLLSEPEIQEPTATRTFEDNQTDSFRYKIKNFVSGRKKFNNILKAIDNNILPLKRTMDLKNYGQDKIN